jgi:hypothetical protein
VLRSAFQWNQAHTEIWHFFALIFLNVQQAQNFSIGIQAVDGQLTPTLYLRMGQIPTLQQYDMKSTTVDGTQILRYYQSGPTMLHDAVWYVGMNVPTSYPSLGDVGIWINTPCPGTTSKLNPDGTTTVTECNGHGVCDRLLHQCACSSEDRWTGWDCMRTDTSLGLSGTARALIVVFTVLITVLFGYGLCWWYRVGMNRSRPMQNAGYGHHLDEGEAGGGPRPARGVGAMGQI